MDALPQTVILFIPTINEHGDHTEDDDCKGLTIFRFLSGFEATKKHYLEMY